jgi:hypothetical protein
MGNIDPKPFQPGPQNAESTKGFPNSHGSFQPYHTKLEAKAELQG